MLQFLVSDLTIYLSDSDNRSKVVTFMENFVSDQQLVNAKLLENTTPAKIKRTCVASKLPSVVREKYFKCAKVDLVAELARLRSYNDEEKRLILLDEVLRYSSVMLGRFHRGEVDEKTYVQPEIKDVFWTNTRGVLACCNLVTLVNERAFSVIMEDEDDRSTVNGITDHAIKMINSDFHIVIVEDKAVAHVLGRSEIAQAKCQMMEELHELDTFLQYVPLEYCGILQNGVSWVFLFHKVRNGKVLWNYVVAPDTFADGVVNEDSCKIVARLLEHVFCIADDIATYICTPKMVIAASSLASVVDDGSDEDNGSEGEEEASDTDGDHRAAEPVARVGMNAVPQAAAQQPNANSSAGARKKGVVADCCCDENLILPFTAENVQKQPAQHYKLML